MEPLIGGITFAFALGYLAGTCSTRLSRKASDPFEEGKARLVERKRESKPEGEPEGEPEPGGIRGPFWAAGAVAAMLPGLLSGRRLEK